MTDVPFFDAWVIGDPARPDRVERIPMERDRGHGWGWRLPERMTTDVGTVGEPFHRSGELVLTSDRRYGTPVYRWVPDAEPQRVTVRVSLGPGTVISQAAVPAVDAIPPLTTYVEGKAHLLGMVVGVERDPVYLDSLLITYEMVP
jgi:hypothetical protein